MKITRIILGLLAVLLIVVAAQSFLRRDAAPTADDFVATEPCYGDPISVEFPYTGTVVEPWTCQVQCEDNQPRYILYSNGLATQCEAPPGCNDYGEDYAITCEPQEERE